jgi:tetratricopeptide (TPR) repeat protein
VPAELAAQWARGSEGLEMQAKVLGRLMQIMRRPVYGEELPAGFAVGDLARFISVSRPDETPTLAAVRGGKLIAVTNLTSLARVRMLLRHSFPKEEQDFATALAAYLQPDCAPAVALTQAVRDQAVRELTVIDHYAPGQILIRRHAVIGENELAALAQLAEKVPAALVPTAPVRAHEAWLLAALAGVSLIAIIALAIAWRALQSRPPVAPLPGRVENFPTTATASSSPPINQAVKDAILQELAAMRAGLSKTSQVPPPPAVPANVSKDKSADSLLVNLHEQCVAGLLAEGQALVVANELDKALKCYDTILTLHPDHAEAFVKMGSVLEKLGRNDEAFASYDCAIAVDDSMTMAYLQKGGLCNRLARYEEATRCYEKALVKQEKSPAEIRFKVP